MKKPAQCPVALIGGAQARIGMMTAAVRPVAPAPRLADTVLPVHAREGDDLVVQRALDDARPGDALVVNANTEINRAVFGDILGEIRLAEGVTGIITVPRAGLTASSSGPRHRDGPNARCVRPSARPAPPPAETPATTSDGTPSQRPPSYLRTPVQRVMRLPDPTAPRSRTTRAWDPGDGRRNSAASIRPPAGPHGPGDVPQPERSRADIPVVGLQRHSSV
ncbi:hypothetical protein GCM10015536_45660 [Streptomyces griseomycini]|nr:hypothetical protein GCM10015536_45660 [Streptomyces griseomycini]